MWPTNKCSIQSNKHKQTNKRDWDPPQPSAGSFLNQIVSPLSSLALISNIYSYAGEETSFCNLWSLTCPRTFALCHAWGAEDNGERGHEKWGGSCEGMLCHKRVSDGHIGGVGQARWNSKKVSGLYNGPAYITVRPTQSSSKLLQIQISFRIFFAEFHVGWCQWQANQYLAKQ